MTETELIYITSQALMLILVLSLPTVGVGALVGLLVGLLQGLTQIQDQTLSFALRLLATIAVLVFTGRWLGVEIQNFAIMMFDNISGLSK